MNELLTNLKKVVDRALDARAQTVEIELAEFPAYVVKSLELILGDEDTERATRRLAMLRAKVDEVAGITKEEKQGEEPPKVQVVEFKAVEPSSEASGPRGRTEEPSPPADAITKTLEAIRVEVAELKTVIGKEKPTEDEGKEPPPTDPTPEPTSQNDVPPRAEHSTQTADPKEENQDKPTVTKVVNWPLDMNATMPGMDAVEKGESHPGWGADPAGLG